MEPDNNQPNQDQTNQSRPDNRTVDTTRDEATTHDLRSSRQDYTAQGGSGQGELDTQTKSRFSRFKNFNPFVVGLIVIVLLAGGTVGFALWYNDRQERRLEPIANLGEQQLSQADFERLAAQQAEIDSTNKTLNVAANAEFKGRVRIQNDLEVAGQLAVGEPLQVSELTVQGSSQLGSLNVDENLTVQQQAEIGGNLGVQGNANISGNAEINGTLTAGSIEAGSINFNGVLTLVNHLRTTGSTPGVSKGTAAGGAGTVSINGTDVSGTVVVNIGGSPPAGRLASVQFRRNYGATPQVVITPIGSDAAKVDYYVQRSQSGFSIFTASPPGSAPKTLVFDYFVIE